MIPVILLNVFLMVTIMVLATLFLVCRKACGIINGTRKMEDVFCFMIDGQYRTLSILRDKFLAECGQDGDYDKWKSNLDMKEVIKFSNQVKYILRRIQ